MRYIPHPDGFFPSVFKAEFEGPLRVEACDLSGKFSVSRLHANHFTQDDGIFLHDSHQGLKAILQEKIILGFEFLQESHENFLPGHGMPQFQGHRSPRIAEGCVHVRRVVIDVHPDAHDEETGEILVGLHFREDPCRLLPSDEDIVGPLDSGGESVQSAQDFDIGEGGHQVGQGGLSYGQRRAQQEGSIDAAPRRGKPGALQPSSAVRLFFGNDDGAVGRSPGSEAQGFIVHAPSTRGINNSVVFRPDNPLVADVRVRQALLAATNRPEIVSTLFSKNYPVATSIIASTAIGYVDQSDKLGFDLEKAKALLDEAGFKPGADGIREKDGQKLVLTAYESLPQPQNKATLQLIAQQWAKVGVTLNVLAGDAGSRTVDDLDPLKTPVSPAMVGRADPDVIKSQYHPKNRDVLRQKGGASDKVKSFVDDKLNALLEGIASEPDRAKRLKTVAETQAYVLDQAYAIPIFEEPQAFAAAPYVEGVAFEAVGRPSFYSVWLNK